jgi:hypothetical protein
MALVIFSFPYQLTMHGRIMGYPNKELLKIRANIEPFVAEREQDNEVKGSLCVRLQ